MKVIRVKETFPMELYEIDGISVKITDWTACFDDKKNTIYLSPQADWKSLLHEIGHKLTSMIPIKRLSYFIDVALIDKYPRWIGLGLFGVKQIW